MSDNAKKMDCRCPRKLEDFPSSWCPLAVLRLKFIRNYGRPITDEEEAKLPGCPWFIANQSSNYCFFKYMHDFGQEKQPSDAEIAHFLNVPVEDVKAALEHALNQVSSHESINEMRSLFDGASPIVDKE